MPEWFVSSLMMDRALDAVVWRVKKLDREHDTSMFFRFTALMRRVTTVLRKRLRRSDPRGPTITV
jgi:hypothetical protein